MPIPTIIVNVRLLETSYMLVGFGCRLNDISMLFSTYKTISSVVSPGMGLICPPTATIS